MLPAIVFITVVAVMVLLCSYQCDCVASNNNVQDRSASVDVILESKGVSDESLPFHEYDESVVDRFGAIGNGHGKPSDGSIETHGYLVSFLPTCPSAYKLTLHQNTSRGGGKGKKSTNLKTGQYTLCQDRGIARLRAHRECSGAMKSCGLTKSEFWITDVESFHPAETPLSSQHLNGLDLEKDALKDVADHCLPRKCSAKQLMAINMKNHMDCGSFYICILGQHFLLHCPTGNQFSEEYGVCLEKKFANCKLSSTCF